MTFTYFLFFAFVNFNTVLNLSFEQPTQSLGSASALTVSALNRHEQIENPVLLPGPGRALDRIVAAHR